MDRQALFERVVAGMVDIMGVSQDDIHEDTKLQDLSADSLDVIELITSLEESLDITIDDEVLTSVNTVGECVDALQDALSEH